MTIGMGYPITLALRYLASKKNNMISISTALAIGGVVLGIALFFWRALGRPSDAGEHRIELPPVPLPLALQVRDFEPAPRPVRDRNRFLHRLD